MLLEELSCEVFPLGVLQACSTQFVATPFTKSARFCSVSGTRFTVLVVYSLPTRSQRDVHRNPWSCPAKLHGKISHLLEPA